MTQAVHGLDEPESDLRPPVDEGAGDAGAGTEDGAEDGAEGASEPPVNRREQIVAVAAELFGQRGFHGVSIAELGAACGFSGPAIYRHFRSKQAILAAMLVGISQELLDVGRRRVEEADSPAEALAALVAWHADFALDHRALIVVQDRDWAALSHEARERVRDTQRAYVEVWVEQLVAHRADLPPDAARAAVHATFGLLNSTPHSGFLDRDRMHELLAAMARRALLDDAPMRP